MTEARGFWTWRTLVCVVLAAVVLLYAGISIAGRIAYARAMPAELVGVPSSKLFTTKAFWFVSEMVFGPKMPQEARYRIEAEGDGVPGFLLPYFVELNDKAVCVVDEATEDPGVTGVFLPQGVVMQIQKNETGEMRAIIPVPGGATRLKLAEGFGSGVAYLPYHRNERGISFVWAVTVRPLFVRMGDGEPVLCPGLGKYIDHLRMQV